MPVAIPASLREAWGEKVAQDMATWFEEVLEQRAVVRDEYRQVLSRLDILERDMSDLKAEVGELRADMKDLRHEFNERFDRVNERLGDMEGRFNRRLDEMGGQFNQRLDEMGRQFNVRLDTMYERMLVHTRWTVGTIVLFGTLITILLAIAQFFKP